MKIALLGNMGIQTLPTVGYGGIQIAIETLAKQMHKEKLDFSVIIPKRISPKKYDFNIIETNAPAGDFSSDSEKQAFDNESMIILKKEKPDVIWSQGYDTIKKYEKLNIPILTTIYDSMNPPNEWFYPYEKGMYIFCSSFHRDNWAKTNEERENSAFIHLGLADEEYDFFDKKDDYILWVASLDWGWEAKGLSDFLKLAKFNPKMKFVIYGNGQYNMQMQLTNYCTLLKNIEYRGPLRRGYEHNNVFKRAKLFCFLTKLPEAFGRVMIEALSKGTPVIGYRNGSVPEILDNNIDISMSCENFEVLNNSLKLTFDYKKCFEYSKKFHISGVLKKMLDHSLELIKK